MAVARLAAFARRLKYTIGADAIHFLLARTSLLDGDGEPPAAINFAGAGDFTAVGDHVARMVIDRAGLQDGQSVLEIGCGIGRNAVALARRLPALRYHGFDIVAYGIAWCRKHFRDRPAFGFDHADIHNSFYNPRGALRADQFRFGYADGAFDVAFATSVFTHMPAREVAHYLVESARCLKPGGTCYFTCFILDDDSRRRIDAGGTPFTFRHPLERAWTERALEPDVAVAFDAPVFAGLVRGAGLDVVRFEPGNWRGGPGTDYQDAFVLRRPR